MIEIEEFTKWENNRIGRHFQAVNAKEEMFYFHHSPYIGLRCVPENLSSFIGGAKGSRLVLFAHDGGLSSDSGFIKIFPCKTEADTSLRTIRNFIYDFTGDEKINEKVEKIPDLLKYLRDNNFLEIKGFSCKLANRGIEWKH